MASELQELNKKIKGVRQHEDLAPYTSFQIGGPAKYFFVARTTEQITSAVRAARELGHNFFILGNGTNVLIADHGFEGLVIKMENTTTDFTGDRIVAESGVKLQKLIRESIAHHLTGLEFLMGIPGTVGGGISGNVGTPTDWIEHPLIEVTVLNAEDEIVTIPKSQCDFSYRFSRFKYNENEIILSAVFQLVHADQKTIQAKVHDFLEKRGHQPINKPCAGSIFKNPPGHKAWQLIDEAGLRGKKIGGAQVSTEHSNFIINAHEATAEDVIILISLIKQQVRDKFGIQLQEEVKYIGF